MGVEKHGLDIGGTLWMDTPHNFYAEILFFAPVSRLFQGSALGRWLGSVVGAALQQQCIQPLVLIDLL